MANSECSPYKYLHASHSVGFHGGSDSKVSARNAGDLGLIPGSGTSPGKGNGNLLQYSCLENSMDGGRSLVGYSPWGHKESDTTEQLHWWSHSVSFCSEIQKIESNADWN